MRVQFTREARQDLAGIARHIANDNPDRARSYIEELRNACLEIGQMPHAYERLQDPKFPDIRRRAFPPYLAFYRVEDNTVVLLRIVHGARNYLRLLGGK